MEPIRIGVIGLGMIGSKHARNITEGHCPDFRLVAVADRHQENIDPFLKAVPDLRVFKTGEDLILSGLCQAVVIAVQHNQHAQLASLALENNIHVMCEKPADVSASRVLQLQSQARLHPELAFGMMFNQRTNEVFRKIKDLLDGGELGQIKRLNWVITNWYRTQSYYDSSSWRATWGGEGGGVLINQCHHQLDLLIWFMGLPVRLQAFCHNGKWHSIQTEDDATVYMEFKDGSTGVLCTSTGDAPGTNRLEISGSRARLVLEDGTLSIDRLKVDEREWRTQCKENSKTPPMKQERMQFGDNPNQHAKVLNAFADHILNGGPMVANIEDGLRAVQLNNAMYLSSWTGSMVELPVDPKRFDECLEELQKKNTLHR